MTDISSASARASIRLGAVNYLNSKPLVYRLDSAADRLAADKLDVAFDLPSRLADALVGGALDVGLIPSIEGLRIPGAKVVSNACIACRGPVRSVKVVFRKRPAEVKRLALDEGSRTSAALTRILLLDRFGIAPETTLLPIGEGLNSADADAVLVIGDRAMNLDGVPAVEVWDLGQQWMSATGLPFVFAMWLAPREVETSQLANLLASVRDSGVARLAEIAAAEGPAIGISPSDALTYFQDNLHFYLGPQELAGLKLFYQKARQLGIAPGSATVSIDQVSPNPITTG